MINDFEQRLQGAAAEWLNARTPFVLRGHSRRFGVDCVHLAHALYTESGIALPPIPRDYFIDESRHSRTGKLLAWIESSGCFTAVPVGGDYRPGTILCGEVGLAPYHVAVVFEPGRAVHAIRDHGVCSISIRDPLFRKVNHAYEVIR